MPTTAPEAYPDARPDRGSAIPATTGQAVTIPRIRLWPFFAASTGNLRRTVVSQAFLGPAVIDSIFYNPGEVINTAGGVGWALLWSVDGSGAGSVATPSPGPPGTKIFDAESFGSNAITFGDEVQQVISLDAMSNTLRGPRFVRLGYPITPDAPFFLKITLRSVAGIEVGLYGVVRVLEGVDLNNYPF